MKAWIEFLFGYWHNREKTTELIISVFVSNQSESKHKPLIKIKMENVSLGEDILYH